MTDAGTDKPPGMLERWNATEPIRVAVYPVAVAVVALLIGYGLLTVERGQLWLAVVVAVVGGGLPIIGGEVARRTAWAPATVRRVADDYAAREADAAYDLGWSDAVQHERLVGDDAPGEHAAPATAEQPAPPAYPATTEIRAQRGTPPTS